MKRRLFLGLAAVAIMASGIAAGAAWTQVAHAQEETAAKGFAARLATILGLEEDVVQDAFKEARSDIQGERFQAKMDRLVESERITQDEADAAIEWYEERPEGIDTSRPGSKSGFDRRRGPGSKSGFYGQRGPGPGSSFDRQRGPGTRSGFHSRRGSGPDYGLRGRGRGGASAGGQS